MPMQMPQHDQLVGGEPGLVTPLLPQPPIQPHDPTPDPRRFREMIHTGYRTQTLTTQAPNVPLFSEQ